MGTIEATPIVGAQFSLGIGLSGREAKGMV